MKTEENLQRNFNGETMEVGLYLAMSKRAEEEGYPQIALYLRQVAMDEAWHAAEVARMLGKIGDTRANLEKMLNGELGAQKGKAEAGRVAREEGNSTAAEWFERASADEARHAAGLKGFLDRMG